LEHPLNISQQEFNLRETLSSLVTIEQVGDMSLS